MVFRSPDWVPKLPFDPPDSVPISEFMLNEVHGRHPLGYSKDPFTCGLSGKSYSALDVKERVDHLSKALAKEFGWHPNEGTEWDKVVGVFSLNTVRSKNSIMRRNDTKTNAPHRLTSSRLPGPLIGFLESPHLPTPHTQRQNSSTN